ncbi:MAG: DUF885 family protein [Alphaproteobacteria bacterium]|nr:DUF885 family protein [Alphaproteobacteria bacterium]
MRKIFAATAFMALAACSPAKKAETAAVTPEVIAQTSKDLNAFLDSEYEKALQFSPESLTSQGRKDQYDKLDDRSQEASQKELEWRRQSVADMKAKFDPAKLDEEAHTSYDVWAYLLNRDEDQNKFWLYPYLAGELGGDHTGLPQFLITQHRVDDKSDMEAYISRVGLIATALDQDIDRAKAAAEKGIRMPRFMYDQAADEAKKVTTGAPFTKGPDSALFADGEAKIKALKDGGKVTAQEADQLTADLAKAMTGTMKPGYDRFIAWLKADEPNTTPDAKGVGALPGGADWYNAALAFQTTTDMTADQIHELGLSEVKRIRGEMEAVKDKTGFKGSLQDFFKYLRTDKKFYYPNTDAGREAYLQQARDDLDAMQAKLPEYFGILPKAKLIVKRVEAFREVPGGAQHYEEGTPDGSRPGTFYVHLSDMNAEPKYQLADIAYHEGLPGHHLQISIQQELTGLPKFRTQSFYTAYVEGWALYAEALAKEMGFDSDPYDDFGRLSGEMWRAIRLVLDTGIHSKGWTQEQAVQYFIDNSPNPEASIRSEVRRYITSPGQATCYKIGMITIRRLRDEAKAQLGDKFDYRAFHDVVLGGGALPLPVLEARVHRWLEKQKAA